MAVPSSALDMAHGDRSLDEEVRDGGGDDGDLDGVGRALGERRRQRDGGVALLRERVGLGEPLLADGVGARRW